MAVGTWEYSCNYGEKEHSRFILDSIPECNISRDFGPKCVNFSSSSFPQRKVGRQQWGGNSGVRVFNSHALSLHWRVRAPKCDLCFFLSAASFAGLSNKGSMSSASSGRNTSQVKHQAHSKHDERLLTAPSVEYLM